MIINLGLQKRVTSAGLVLVTLLGTYLPANAEPDCDLAPDAPICNGEPRPSPRPRPDPRPQPVPPITNYPAAISLLLQNRVLVEQTIDTVWSQFGRAVAAEKIKNELSRMSAGRFGGRAVWLKDVEVNLRDIAVKEVTPGPEPNQVSLRLVIPDNNTKVTANVKYLPDPTFRVYYTLTLNLILTVDNSSQPIKVNQLNVQISDAKVQDANIAAWLIQGIDNLFTGGDLTRSIESKINQDIPLLKQLSAYIKSAIDQIRQQLGV